MKRLTKYQLIKNMLKKIFLPGVMLFAFPGFSVAQSTAFNSPSYRQNLLKEEHQISEKLKTDKEDLHLDKHELHEEKNMIRKISNIPPATVEKFKTNFPKAKNISWLRINGYVGVGYTINKKKMVNFYDANNNLVGSGKYLPYQSLPARGRRKIVRYYKKYIPEQMMYYANKNPDFNSMSLFRNGMNQNDYYVLLRNKENGTKEIVLRVSPFGVVSYFNDVNQNS